MPDRAKCRHPQYVRIAMSDYKACALCGEMVQAEPREPIGPATPAMRMQHHEFMGGDATCEDDVA